MINIWELPDKVRVMFLNKIWKDIRLKHIFVFTFNDT